MDATKRFDGKGEIYAKARPKYAVELLEYMKNELHIPAESVFADVGSGTGIFTGQLLQEGYRVLAVEPNGDMRKKAEEKLSVNPNFVSVNGTEAHMGLPNHSVDFVTAAQAFHWFDPEAFKKECGRVLKPGGKVMIVYHFRDDQAACIRALADLRRRYNPEFHGFSNGISPEKCMAFFDGKCEVFHADNIQTYDRQGYVDRVLSSSYSLKETDGRYAEYLKEINEIFDRFSAGERIAVPAETVAYIGQI